MPSGSSPYDLQSGDQLIHNEYGEITIQQGTSTATKFDIDDIEYGGVIQPASVEMKIWFTTETGTEIGEPIEEFVENVPEEEYVNGAGR